MRLEAALVPLVVGLACCASVTDIRTREIPNWLTLSVTAFTLLLRAASGLSVLAEGFQGWILGLVLLVVPFVYDWVGAGDVKLLAALGALLGPQLVLLSLGIACGIGCLLLMPQVLAEARSVARQHLRSPGQRTHALSNKRDILPYPFPFAPALSLGALIALVIRP